MPLLESVYILIIFLEFNVIIPVIVFQEGERLGDGMDNSDERKEMPRMFLCFYKDMT